MWFQTRSEPTMHIVLHRQRNEEINGEPDLGAPGLVGVQIR
jgi:hypothetical protein